MNNKQSCAQGREFTLALSPLCFLTLDLQATSKSPTEFIANFWCDPLCGLDLRERDEHAVNLPATIEQQTQQRCRVFRLRGGVDELRFMLLTGGS